MSGVRNSVYWFTQLPIGILLLAAAGFKAYQLATTPTPDDGLLTSRWFLLAIVEIELLVGLLLLFNLASQYTRVAAIVLFAGFAAVSSYNAAMGASHCGCFGELKVNPWWMLALDIACVIALARSLLVENVAAATPFDDRLRNARFGGFVFSAAAVAIPVTVAVWSFKPAQLGVAGTLTGESEIVVLEPETWLGDKFPLANYIDIGSDLEHGNWIVVLFHHDCPKCREAIADYQRKAGEMQDAGGSTRIALVELPPFDVDESHASSQGELLRYGRLSEAKQWFASTPCEIKLSDGLTKAVSVQGKQLVQDKK